MRVCADGKVVGLKGNQCNFFGMGKDLINATYNGTYPPGNDGGASDGGTGIMPQLGSRGGDGDAPTPSVVLYGGGPSFGGLPDFNPNLDGLTVINFNPAIKAAAKEEREESWLPLDFD